MSAPTVTTATTTVYDALPALYRDADAAQADGPSSYPLLRFLSLVLDQLQPVVDLVDRLRFTPADEFAADDQGNEFGVSVWPQMLRTGTYGSGTYGTGPHATGQVDDASDLVNAASADAGWFPWMAQLLGVTLEPGATVAVQRAALADPSTTWAHGTPAAITAAARRSLPATSPITIVPHLGGDPFTIGIVSDVEPGLSGATWGGLEIAAPSWAELNGRSFVHTSELGATVAHNVIAAAEKERPAGFRFTYNNA